MPRATIDDVAELAGVSIKTVSRVVNQEPNVREETREKVEKAIAQLHYRPNLSARNLASQRSRVIALVYDDPSAYEIPSAGYIIRMQNGILRACHTADYRFLIHPCNYRSESIGKELKALIEHARPHGIVLAAPLSNMPKIVRAIAATGTPIVRLSPGTRNGEQYSVATNDREVSAEMTGYLAERHRVRCSPRRGRRQLLRQRRDCKQAAARPCGPAHRDLRGQRRHGRRRHPGGRAHEDRRARPAIGRRLRRHLARQPALPDPHDHPAAARRHGRARGAGPDTGVAEGVTPPGHRGRPCHDPGPGVHGSRSGLAGDRRGPRLRHRIASFGLRST